MKHVVNNFYYSASSLVSDLLESDLDPSHFLTSPASNVWRVDAKGSDKSTLVVFYKDVCHDYVYLFTKSVSARDLEDYLNWLALRMEYDENGNPRPYIRKAKEVGMAKRYAQVTGKKSFGIDYYGNLIVFKINNLGREVRESQNMVAYLLESDIDPSHFLLRPISNVWRVETPSRDKLQMMLYYKDVFQAYGTLLALNASASDFEAYLKWLSLRLDYDENGNPYQYVWRAQVAGMAKRYAQVTGKKAFIIDDWGNLIVLTINNFGQEVEESQKLVSALLESDLDPSHFLTSPASKLWRVKTPLSRDKSWHVVYYKDVFHENTFFKEKHVSACDFEDYLNWLSSKLEYDEDDLVRRYIRRAQDAGMAKRYAQLTGKKSFGVDSNNNIIVLTTNNLGLEVEESQKLVQESDLDPQDFYIRNLKKGRILRVKALDQTHPQIYYIPVFDYTVVAYSTLWTGDHPKEEMAERLEHLVANRAGYLPGDTFVTPFGNFDVTDEMKLKEI